jgi:signal transduction histidine kinase
MRERANRLRGSLDIEGAPNEGTRITVRIPAPRLALTTGKEP